MKKLTRTITLDARTHSALRAIIARCRQDNPGIRVTMSDAIRHVITAGLSALIPPTKGTT
jgi:hypothetical protein